MRCSVQRFALILTALFVVAMTQVEETRAQDDYQAHFVSLRHNTVNVRTGPGTRYPIEWVYKRARLPLEAIAEFEQWIKIRDYEGAEGWIHRRLLSSERWAVVTGSLRTVRREPRDDGAPVLYAEPGVQGHLLACRNAWCEIEIGSKAGWIRQEVLYGVYPGEVFD